MNEINETKESIDDLMSPFEGDILKHMKVKKVTSSEIVFDFRGIDLYWNRSTSVYQGWRKTIENEKH